MDGHIHDPLNGMVPVEPCPFCGSRGIEVDKTESTRLKCGNCGAAGPTWDWREERAVHSWNSWPKVIAAMAKTQQEG